MFVVLVNNTANPGMQRYWGHLLSAPLNRREPLEMTHGKFIDDASILEAIDMDNTLKPQDENYWTRPLIRRSRFELALPEKDNLTSAKLKRIIDYARKHFMKINIKKTKVVMFNPARRGIPFKPVIKLDGSTLDVTEQVRLVGFILTDDLSWKKNTESLVNRAYKKCGF